MIFRYEHLDLAAYSDAPTLCVLSVVQAFLQRSLPFTRCTLASPSHSFGLNREIENP